MTKTWTAIVGAPKSRTSLAMRAIRHAMPIVSMQWPTPKRDAKGTNNDYEIYEHPAYLNGFASSADVRGKAVKVMAHAFPGKVDLDGLGKIILCVRNPRDMAESQTGLKSDVQVKDGDGWKFKRLAINPNLFIAYYMPIAMRLDAFRRQIMVVDYAEWNTNAEAVCKRINGFLGMAGDTAKMAAEFKPELTRARLKEWPNPLAEAGELADLLYAALRDRDTALVASRIEVYSQQQRLESARFWDERVGYMSNPAHERQLSVNLRGCLDKLVVIHSDRRVKGLCAISCPHRQPSDKVESVNVPLDLSRFPKIDGDHRIAEVPMIHCGRDDCDVTQAACQACWRTQL